MQQQIVMQIGLQLVETIHVVALRHIEHRFLQTEITQRPQRLLRHRQTKALSGLRAVDKKHVLVPIPFRPPLDSDVGNVKIRPAHRGQQELFHLRPPGQMAGNVQNRRRIQAMHATDYPIVNRLQGSGILSQRNFRKRGKKGVVVQGIVDKLLITSRGDKWVNTVRGSNVGITVFNEKGTIDDTSDDVVNHFSLFSTANGDAISVSGYFCMAEDKKGNIWLGTNRGPIICPVPNRAIDDPDQIYCTRIIRELNGENSYFLDNVQINAIAVDGGNRKWLGTEGAGIFVVSEDGSETIENFTTDNSPLLSDVINSIAIDDVTGEVFIGTDKGIISYMGEATEGSESYSEVYAYPNPVRPQYGDKVTITGLMSDSNVKITDVAGHLVYQGKSLGGQLTWNCRSYRGERVASGVYLVLAATPEGKESVVTKIVVVK